MGGNVCCRKQLHEIEPCMQMFVESLFIAIRCLSFGCGALSASTNQGTAQNTSNVLQSFSSYGRETTSPSLTAQKHLALRALGRLVIGMSLPSRAEKNRDPSFFASLAETLKSDLMPRKLNLILLWYIYWYQRTWGPQRTSVLLRCDPWLQGKTTSNHPSKSSLVLKHYGK